MLYWSLSTFLIIHFTLLSSHDAKSDISGSRNLSSQVCFQEEAPDSKYRKKIWAHESPELKGMSVIRGCCLDKPEKRMANHAIDLDNPNMKQALLSQAFIQNANYVFDKMYKREASYTAESSTNALIKYPKLGYERYSRTNSQMMGSELSSRNGLEEYKHNCNDDSTMMKNRQKKHKEESEMRVHCMRTGPNEIICKHENLSFSFRLPQELFKKSIMEKLVSSVFSIVEESIPDGDSNIGGVVNIAVSKIQPRKEEDNLGIYTKAINKEFPKIIKINIPIDFSAIPLNDDDEDKHKMNKQVKSNEESLSEYEQGSFVSTEKQKSHPIMVEDNYVRILQEHSLSQDNLPSMNGNNINLDSGLAYKDKLFKKRKFKGASDLST